MNSIKQLKSLLIVVVCLLSIYSPSIAQQNTANEESENVISPGPVTRPMIIEIGPDTYFINEYGMNAIYLIVGQKRALMLDSGSGYCDLDEIVKSITDLPYDVAITHGHPDHAGGMGQFDTVYMHPADIEIAGRISYEQELEYGEIIYNMDNGGYKDVWGYSKSDLRKYTEWPEIKPLYDGQVFDLGGRKVTVYHTPGHSLGACVFLDTYSRILFSGDATLWNVGTNIAVSTTIRYLLRLQKMRAEYDQIYTGHINYAGKLDVFSMRPELLDDIIDGFRSILHGDPDLVEVSNELFPEMKQIRANYGKAQVGYNPDRLWEEGEDHIIP